MVIVFLFVIGSLKQKEQGCMRNPESLVPPVLTLIHPDPDPALTQTLLQVCCVMGGHSVKCQ